MKEEDCKGCHTMYVSKDGICLWFYETLYCPCHNCLIKVMCRDACDLLDDHIVKTQNLREKTKLEKEVEYGYEKRRL